MYHGDDKKKKNNKKKGDRHTIYAELKKSTRNSKKFMIRFYKDEDGVVLGRTTKPFKTVHFGAAGYEDYTIHKDDYRKERYYMRHNRPMVDPMSADTLSKLILWNRKSLSASFRDYRNRYNYKNYPFS